MRERGNEREREIEREEKPFRLYHGRKPIEMVAFFFPGGGWFVPLRNVFNTFFGGGGGNR